MTRLALAAGTAALLAVSATSAPAATPANGTVSKASPKLSWTGEVVNSYFNRIPVVLTEDDSVPCGPSMCDAFALTVADKDDLTLTADGPEGSTSEDPAQVTVRVRKPDGSVVVTTGDATVEKPLQIKIKQAATGDYDVEYFNNFVGPAPYTATATLGFPGATAGPLDPLPTPAPVQDIAVTVTAPKKLSAKKLAKAKKVSVKVGVSRAVSSVTATLKKGSKKIGTGKLGATSGTKTVAVKVPKSIKKGSYSLTVTAADGSTTALKTVKLKIGK